MLLIDEKGDLVSYGVQFKNDKYTKRSVELDLVELLSNPTITEEKEIIKGREPEINHLRMTRILDSPLIIQTESVMGETIERTIKHTIHYCIFMAKFIKKMGI